MAGHFAPSPSHLNIWQDIPEGNLQPEGNSAVDLRGFIGQGWMKGCRRVMNGYYHSAHCFMKDHKGGTEEQRSYRFR